jgi:hypothetical protein
MPCIDDDYSQPRGMDPAETWKSFSRHHRVLELETEAWRVWGKATIEKLDELKRLFPGVDLTGPPMPMETPRWKGLTYRDGKGRFPNDIREHLDWLSEDDFK